MRKVLLLLALLPFILRGEPQVTHTVYLPTFPHRPYPACERLDNVGLAWLDNSVAGAQTDLDNFCGSMYYNASGGSYATIHPNEKVLIWGNRSQDILTAQTVPSGYCDYAIILNEPGIHGQFYAPTGLYAAQAYAEVSALLPSCAKRISPNVIIQTQGGTYNSVAYLNAFLDGLVQVQGYIDLYAVGIHIYGAESTSATTKLNWVASAMAARGLNIPIIVTEYGVFNTGDVAGQMQAMTYQIATHAKVEAFFGYTVRNSQNAVPWVQSVAYWPGLLSPSGQGWFAGLEQSGGIP